MCLKVYASGQKCHSHIPLISCKHLFITALDICQAACANIEWTQAQSQQYFLENLHDLITAGLPKIAFLYLASLLSSNAHVQDMTYCILVQKGDFLHFLTSLTPLGDALARSSSCTSRGYPQRLRRYCAAVPARFHPTSTLSLTAWPK